MLGWTCLFRSKVYNNERMRKRIPERNNQGNTWNHMSKVLHELYVPYHCTLRQRSVTFKRNDVEISSQAIHSQVRITIIFA